MLELGYATNPEEGTRLSSEEYQLKVVNALAEGVDSYARVMNPATVLQVQKAPVVETPPAPVKVDPAPPVKAKPEPKKTTQPRKKAARRRAPARKPAKPAKPARRNNRRR